ncbi:MAG: sigma-70 family RNA polymerase sigma factor [Bacteroidota bacterium]
MITVSTLNNNRPAIAETESLIKAAIENIIEFSKLYDLYYVSVFRFIYKRNGNKEHSADITSTVFLKAMEHLKSYQFRGIPFEAWLLRIASNEIVNYFREKKLQLTYNLDSKEIKNMSDKIEESDHEENWQRLVNAMQKLRPDEMELLHLRYFDGFSFLQIGAICHITENNAKVKMHRILQSLKNKLNQ